LKEQLDTLATTRSSQEILRERRALVKEEKHVVHVLELSQQRAKLEGQLDALPSRSPDELEKRAKRARVLYRSLKQVVQVGTKLVQLKKDLKKLPTGDKLAVSRQVGVLQQDTRGLTNRIRKLSKNLGSMVEELRQVTELRKKIKELRTTLKSGKSAERKLQCLQALKHIFGPSGLKQDRFRAILSDAMERTIPAYSNLLWPHKKVSLELDDAQGSLQFLLKRRGRKELVRSNLLSGGENHKAALAFLLGMRDLKEIYTGSSFNLLIIDEPFGNLDPQGTESLLAILEALKHRFSTIIVISHRPEVVYSNIWDQTWWAIRKNGVSRLYTDDPPLKYQKLAQRYAVAGESI
jgi:DNA repair exonuclease SbcCD ATPase subunit